jgi:hypothetical protein
MQQDKKARFGETVKLDDKFKACDTKTICDALTNKNVDLRLTVL